MAASSPLMNAGAPCSYFKSALDGWVFGAALCEQRARRRACEDDFVSSTVDKHYRDYVPLQASFPLTTRHRRDPPKRVRVARTSSTHDLYESRSRLWRPCFPRAQHTAWGRVLVPVAPRLTQSPEGCRSGAPTPGPSHLLQPDRQPHPTFQVGRRGEQAIWPLMPGMATHRP